MWVIKIEDKEYYNMWKFKQNDKVYNKALGILTISKINIIKEGYTYYFNEVDGYLFEEDIISIEEYREEQLNKLL